jgi:hypothetical protein
MNNILDDADESIINTRAEMKLTKLYNQVTGANLSHWQLKDLGLLERTRIISAIELWDV